MAQSQLTVEKRNWIRNCYWKTENVTEVQRRWGSEFGIWCLQWTFWTYVTLNIKRCNSLYLDVNL
jgi:hypothetical protein